MFADSGGAGGWVILILIVVLVVSKLASNAKRSGGSGLTKAYLTDVGRRPDGTLVCPNCGGTQFTAKRSAVGKAGFGLLARKSQVQCVTCGTIYRRG